MITPSQIIDKVAAAFGRNIQDFIFGNIALNEDGSNPSDVPYTVPVKVEGQEETYFAYWSPFIDATKLSDNTRVKMLYERDGNLTIVDADDVAARESYPNPPPRSFVLSQHNHSSAEQGGQLNISNAINAGVLAQDYGGTGANLSASSVGSIFYQNAFGQFVALAAVASGNVLRSAGLLTAPAYGKVVMTTDITGITPVANGGTGKATNTTGVLLLGAGTSAMTELAPGTSGNLAQSNGTIWTSAAPSFAASVITSGQLVLERGGTEADLSATGAGHLIQATTGAAVSVIKDNFAATAAPNPATDDNTAGYAVGSLWLDTTNDNIYMAIDVSTGAAVWEQLNGGGVGSSPFVQGTGEVYLDNPADSVIIGDTGEDLGRFTIRGIADEPQLAIRLNGTQTQSGILVQNTSPATVFSVSGGGDIYGLGALEIDGAFNHDGSTFGALGAAPAAQQAQTVDLKDALVTFGFYSGSGGATPLDTDGGLVTAFVQGEASTTSLATLNIPNGTAPTSPVTGDVWGDSAYGFTFRNKGKTQTPRWAGFTQAARVTVSGTSTATTLLSTIYPTGGNAFPANYFQVGSAIRIRMSGEHVTSSGSDTPLLRFRFGGSNIMSTTFPTLTNVSGAWTVDVLIVCRTAGASGRFTGSLMGFCQTNTGVNDVEANANNHDTTGALTLDILIDPSGTTLIWDCDQIEVTTVN